MKSCSANAHVHVKILQGAILLLSCLMVLSLPTAFGQKGENGSLYGAVTDSTGAVIASAKVTATNLGTNLYWTSVSDASGNYVIPDLPIGQYKVDAEQAGFGIYEATGISVVVGQHTRVDVVLHVGTTKQTITVTVGAPLVDTESAAVAGTVERQFVDQLPLVDRTIGPLEVIQAGTSNNTKYGEVTVNGQRAGLNEYMLNGITINNPQFVQVEEADQLAGNYPSPDAIQEFTLIKTGYEAQYGRTGGAQVIVATRSGTNQYHGSAFDYLRNDVLDSRSFFAANKTPYKRNIFGGTVGGPIWKNTLFFFFSYQGAISRASPNSGVENVVPTQAERQGNFSAIATPIIDPTTNEPFTGNTIPTARLSSITQNLMNALVPLANGPNGELIYAPTNNINSNQEIGKVDYILSSKDHVSGSLFIERTSNTTQAALPKLYTSTETPYTIISVNETHSFSPTLLSDFTIGGSYLGYTVAATDVGGPYTWGTFGSTYFIPPINRSIVGSVSGNVSVNDVTPALRPGQLLQAQESIHWIRGNHTFVFGGTGTQARTWTTTGSGASGNFGFNGFSTGNAIADFALGIPSSFSQNLTAYIPHFGQDYEIYAQDTWRMSHHVTLNYGLRFAPTWYETNTQGENANFIAGEQSTVFPTAPRGLVYPGDPGIDGNYLHSPNLDVFEPRLGIAWVPFGHSSWVVRSAFGEFHQPWISFSVDNNLTWPYTLTTSIVDPPSLANPWQGGVDPFPFSPVLPSAPSSARQSLATPPVSTIGEFLSTDTKLPTSLMWNFTIQHQLGSHNGIEAAYVGSRTYRVYVTEDDNPPYYISGECGTQACSTAANVNSRRPWSGFATVYMNHPVGVDNYNALQLTYRHEVTRGLTLLADYTWAKTMSLAVNDYDNTDSLWDPFHLSRLYAPAQYDEPQIFNIAYAWNLPWFASGRGIGGHLVKGWTFSGYLNVRSGLPLTILTGENQSLSGYGTDHADQIGTWQIAGGRSRGQQVSEWFNTGAFTLNAVGTYGDTGRDIVRGPGGRFWDMSFFREFPIGERIKLQYRFDGSNIFNHTVLQSVNTTLSSSAFGEIGSTGNPRILQMALRLVF